MNGSLRPGDQWVSEHSDERSPIDTSLLRRDGKTELSAASADGYWSVDTAPIRTSVVRRTLSSKPNPDDRIKILDDDEVKEVTFVRQENQYVYYHPIVQNSNKGSSAQKRSDRGKATAAKPLWIDKALAFDLGVPNLQIKAEAKATSLAREKTKSAKASVNPKLMAAIREHLDEEVSDEILLAALVDLSISGFTVDDLGEDDVLDDWIEQIENALRGNAPELTNKQMAESKTGGGKGKTDWKTTHTSDQQKAMRDELPPDFPGVHLISQESELDHKIARASLKHMIKELDAAPLEEPGVKEMHGFVSKVKLITHAADEQKAIENWPANLELGFYGDDRVGNPGSSFDGAYTASGTATPRTAHLEDADAIINSAAIDWEALVAKLEAAQREQEILEKKGSGIGRGANQLTAPRKGIWKPAGDDTYERHPKRKGEKK